MESNVRIMGIINVTPDSFYSGSRSFGEDGRPDAALLRRRMQTAIDEGADILDIGACSTRPGSSYVLPEEEWARLLPAIRMARELCDGKAAEKGVRPILISIDTFRAEIVRRAYDVIGPFMVNDISSGEEDPAMLPLSGRLGLTYIAMHKRGLPNTMQSLTHYGKPITQAVMGYFEDFALKARANGIEDWILDPGFGFAKTLSQNYRLLAELPSFLRLGRPILVGISRKSMIYKPLGITPEEALTPTQVLNFEALRGGASILRVHDVLSARQTLALFHLLKTREPDGAEAGRGEVTQSSQ